jgi:hypothetical protein
MRNQCQFGGVAGWTTLLFKKGDFLKRAITILFFFFAIIATEASVPIRANSREFVAKTSSDLGVLIEEKIVNHETHETHEIQYLWGLDLNGQYQGLGGVGGLLAVMTALYWYGIGAGIGAIPMPLT